ncbi:hypothetical protein [Evansella clarkii]|uniref:hypothetical protein n=1 Tax=Evansella clarkii TaxID=79879 RepID=UPI001FD0BE9E|nr:hypothetical protein [Evansella clarkii]
MGFDQKVLIHHLDYTAKQSKKNTKTEMYAILDGFLREDITGAKSRKNAITMLMKIWVNVPDELILVREEVLKNFNEFTKEERLFVHWCMTIVAYPFFKDVATEFGRLFQVQENISSTSISKRMKESYGDRRRVEVATSAVLMSMKAWKIIIPGNNKTYMENQKVYIDNPLLHALLLDTLLTVLESDTIYVDMATNHPLFFPFQYKLNLQQLKKRKNSFSIYNQGVENLIVEKI